MHRWFKSWIALLLAMAVASCADSTTDPQHSISSHAKDSGGTSVPAKTFSISGQVLDGETNLPISGATVILGGAAQDTTKTNASGNYTFAGLAVGTYTISTGNVSGYGFAQTSQTVNVAQTSVVGINCIGFPRRPPPTSGTLIISGKITDTTGGISGVTVMLAGSAIKTATTNATGDYTFTQLAAGTYGIVPRLTGLVFTPLGLSVTLTTASATQQDFTAASAPATTPTFSISGVVATSTGTAISGVAVALSGAATGSVVTGNNGSYSFTGLANGAYVVTPTRDGYSFAPAARDITINNGNSAANNFTGTPPPPPTFSVSGRIINGSGAALAGVTVAMSGDAAATATSNSTGDYTFTSLAAGSYTITPTLSGILFTPVDQTIAVTTANVNNINFTGAAPTFSVAGRVVLDSGTGLSGVTVALSGASTGTATTDTSGNYLFNDLVNGDYTVTPSLVGYTFAPASLNITLNNANGTVANFVATPPAIPTYTISGLITDDAGEPAPITGVTVTLAGTDSRTITTDAMGTYSFSGLSNGSYSITAAFTDYTFAPLSRSVVVNSANVPNQNFVGTPPAAPPPSTYTISGSITDNNNVALSGVTITLSGAANATFTTSASGAYSFPGLANGTYSVTAAKVDYTFAAGPTSVTLNGADVPNQNFTGTPVPRFTISGHVTDGTVALSGATLSIAPGGATTTSDAAGNYSFSGLLDGTYTITTALTGYTFASLPVTISGANQMNQNIVGTAVVAPTYSVTGRITLPGTTTGVNGATVTLSGAAGLSATTNATGDFTIAGVADGSYTLTPSLTGYTFTPATLNITVAGANLTNRNFSATPPVAATYSISGRIADRSDAPAVGVAVALSGGATANAVTNASGVFTFTGLANGAYTLTPALSGYLFSPISLGVAVNGANVAGSDFVATPPAPGARNYSLFITAGTLTIADGGGTAIPAWSFTDAAGTPMFPGPTITANEGDTVNINVTNNHTIDHNLVIQGVTTDAAPIPPGTSKMISFTATKAGTFIYADTLNNNINRSMGLHGALVVGPASGGNAAWTGGPTYTFARTWVTSDIDKARWNDVAGTGGTVNTANYKPNYFVINGMGGAAAMNDRTGTAIDGTVGQVALVRIVNAGQYRQSFHFHANHVQIISINGVRQTAPYKLADVVTVPPMETMELIFVLNQPGTYPMHNHTAQMETANGTYGNGVLTMIYIR